jgi:DHA1 family multidrug resistance protein-like MFS transporter
MGYTGFTLVMPFLPLFIAQLGVSDVGEIAMWTGIDLLRRGSLAAPAWGRSAIVLAGRSWSSDRW